jgi:hypothetical protein
VDISTQIFHYVIVIICLIGLFFIGKILPLLKHDSVVLSMAIASLISLADILIYSITMLIDRWDGSFSVDFYNWYSLFVWMQVVISFGWASFLTYRRMKK